MENINTNIMGVELKFPLMGWFFATVGTSFFAQITMALVLGVFGALGGALAGYMWKNWIEPKLPKNKNLDKS